jgi:hypothetical protein
MPLPTHNTFARILRLTDGLLGVRDVIDIRATLGIDRFLGQADLGGPLTAGPRFDSAIR